MTTYFVSRHPGAKAWAERHLGRHQQVDELPDLGSLRPGDTVCGTLPAHLAADVVERGVRYRHLRVNLPREARGGELSLDEMEAHGARLVDLDVHRVGPPLPDLRIGGGDPIGWLRNRWRRLDGLVLRSLALFCAAIVAAVAPGVIGLRVGTLIAEPGTFVGASVASLLVIGSLVTLVATFRPEAPESLRRLARRQPLVGLLGLIPRSGVADWNLPSLVATVVLGAVGFGLSVILGGEALVFTLWMGIFAVAAGTIAALGRGLFRIEIVQVPISTCEPRPVVLMFLSNLTDRGRTLVVEKTAEGTILTRVHEDRELVATTAHAAALAKLLAGETAPKFGDLIAKSAFPGSPQFSWQQNFRVLESQFGAGPDRLAEGLVVVLTSPESHDQFAIFKEALERVAVASEVRLEVREFPEVDPLRLSDMESAIRHIVHDLVDEKPSGDRGKWRYDQILVDTTAGSKLTSIAGATTTFASEMVFCYVYDAEVWMLDARSSLGNS